MFCLVYLSGYVYYIQLWFCLVAFLRTCALHTRWFVLFGSLYVQVIQGFIHDDHADVINKHVMMIRVTDNIQSVKDGDIVYHTTAGRLIRRSIIHTRKILD